MLHVIEQIRTEFPDAEINLDVMGFSRGSTAVKQLLNEISERFPNDPNIKLNRNNFV